MSNENNQFTIEIPEDEAYVKSHEQYGMTYPDGSVKWSQEEGYSPTGGKVTTHFHLLAEMNSNGDYARQMWIQVLRTRAEKANLPVPEYRDQHQLVKRTIVIAVTELGVVK